MVIHSFGRWMVLGLLGPRLVLAQSPTNSTTDLSTQVGSQTQGTSTSTTSGGSSILLTTTLANASATSSSPSTTPASSTITAEYPSLSGVPVCVTQCLQGAVAQANCTSIIDVRCFCQSKAFVDTVTGCVAQGCYDQVAEAQQLAQRFCNIASATLTFPPATSPAPSASASGPASGAGSAQVSGMLLVGVGSVWLLGRTMTV